MAADVRDMCSCIVTLLESRAELFTSALGHAPKVAKTNFWMCASRLYQVSRMSTHASKDIKGSVNSVCHSPNTWQAYVLSRFSGVCSQNIY